MHSRNCIPLMPLKKFILSLSAITYNTVLIPFILCLLICLSASPRSPSVPSHKVLPQYSGCYWERDKFSSPVASGSARSHHLLTDFPFLVERHHLQLKLTLQCHFREEKAGKVPLSFLSIQTCIFPQRHSGISPQVRFLRSLPGLEFSSVMLLFSQTGAESN